jgi:hypothetical protein
MEILDHWLCIQGIYTSAPALTTALYFVQMDYALVEHKVSIVESITLNFWMRLVSEIFI